MSDRTPESNVQLIDAQTLGRMLMAPAGALNVAELIRLVGGNFESGTFSGLIYSVNEINGGTATIVLGEGVLATNTTADGAVQSNTINRARFITATFNIAHMAIQMENPNNPNVIRRWGMYDPVDPIFSGDGVYFENSSGELRVVQRKGGVDAIIADENGTVAAFNGSDLAGTSNTWVKDSNVHIYELIYNAGQVLFMQDRKLIHMFTSLVSVAFETVHLRLGAECNNINGNTTPNTLKTRGFACSRIGTKTTNPDFVRFTVAGTTLLKNGPGTLSRIIILDTGVGGAALTLYDNTTESGKIIAEIDLTDSLITLLFEFDFNFGLTAVFTGSQFEVLIIYN